MTIRSPQHQPGDDPFAVARALLQAEADQRGISVEVLVDQLARQGRMPVGPIDLQPPIDVIGDEMPGLALPKWADGMEAWASRSRPDR
ncbi:hypothetical protein [Streptomyces canus]|uniref:hypothetical protein n=1 Tax=Streptomyces canus TaxID=58343 RepID=UPI002E2E6762|nr:hypothetical protein [Streptomyces canus]